jgi:hypothetical protein
MVSYSSPKKGDDGLYFVDTTSEEGLVLVQLNNVNMNDISDDITFDLNSETNINKIDVFDKGNMDQAITNQEEWFGKKISKNVIERAYVRSVNNGQITGELIDATRIFNQGNELVDREYLQVGKKCNILLELNGIWFAKKTFGPSWNVVQVKVFDDPEPEPEPEPEPTVTSKNYPDQYALLDEDDQ